MSKPAQEFDQLLTAVLERADAAESAAVDARGIPSEVAGEDLGLLKVALDIQRHFSPHGPDEDFLRTSEIRLLNQLKAKQRRATQTSPDRTRRRLPIWRRLLKPVPVLASLLLVAALTLGSFGVAGASAASLPGDALYPVKRGLERARLAVSFSSKGDAALLAAFAEERIEELEELSSLDRLEDMDQAIEGYLEISDQLDDLADDPDSNADQYQQELANNIQVLQRVLQQVPPQAQPAIQRAIDRSLEKAEQRGPDKEGQGAGKPTSDPSEQGQGTEKREQRQAEQNQRTAEQIANQYEGVTPEAVMLQYEGDCEGDWQCVRSHFREQEQNQNSGQGASREAEQNQRRAEQIGRQYGVSTQEVMNRFNGACGQDWKCVRDYYRER